MGDPHGSFKKPTTGSRNQLKVTAGTCGLGSSQRGRRDEGREGGREAARDQNEITARERGLRLGTGRWGAAEQDVQGSPTHGCPPRDCCSPNPSTEL